MKATGKVTEVAREAYLYKKSTINKTPKVTNSTNTDI